MKLKKMMAVIMAVFAAFSPVKGKNVEGIVKISSSETILSQVEEQNGNIGVECPKFVHVNSLKVLPRVSWGYKAKITGGRILLTELVPANSIVELDRKIRARDERRVEVRRAVAVPEYDTATPVVRSAHRVAPGAGGKGIVQAMVAPTVTRDIVALKKTIVDLNKIIDQLMKKNADLSTRADEGVKHIARIGALEDQVKELQGIVFTLEAEKKSLIEAKEKDGVELDVLKKDNRLLVDSLASVNATREKALADSKTLEGYARALNGKLEDAWTDPPSHLMRGVICSFAVVGGCTFVFLGYLLFRKRKGIREEGVDDYEEDEEEVVVGGPAQPRHPQPSAAAFKGTPPASPSGKDDY